MEQLRSPIEQKIQNRLISLHNWIDKQRPLLSATDKVKLTVNIKGDHVVGEITAFPEN